MASSCNAESVSSCNDTVETVHCIYDLDTALGFYGVAGLLVDIQVFDDGYFPEQDHLHAFCAAILTE